MLELLTDGEMTAGGLCGVIRRLYAVDPRPLREVDQRLDHFRQFWTPPLHALASELARGRRGRRLREGAEAMDDPPEKQE
ncbi:hypothetical protein [Micromonospora sp. NPDC047074]|uniref:hypothetical protein n=1 Tax=Micromonospora sp. NPDC047074 TaxID=3154339 RepID=UPI0033F39D11